MNWYIVLSNKKTAGRVARRFRDHFYLVKVEKLERGSYWVEVLNPGLEWPEFEAKCNKIFDKICREIMDTEDVQIEVPKL